MTPPTKRSRERTARAEARLTIAALARREWIDTQLSRCPDFTADQWRRFSLGADCPSVAA
jgi:hypothetical protein